MKFLGIKNESGQSGYICYEDEDEGCCYPVRNDWIYEKRAQLWGRLAFVTHILVRKLLYQQGYMIVRGTYWLNMLKWPRNPENYSIHKKYNYEFLIRISEYEAYKSESLGTIKPICDSPLKYIYRINGKDITVNFSDLDDNCEFVRRIFQISP